MKALGVYIHIPFCVQKCVYCDFLSAPATREKQQTYLTALKKEIMEKAKNYTDYVVETIFFGGGTPSILEAEDIAEGIRDYISGMSYSPEELELCQERLWLLGRLKKKYGKRRY